MLHADWGLLDLNLLVVFDSTSDEERWFSGSPWPTGLGDRDSQTGFGVIAGNLGNSVSGGAPFVLVPEDLP